MRTFVMGDIHGAYKALLQCLERSSFDYEKDQLIQLGDVVDGYPEVADCIEELLKIKRLIAIKGNHDEWFNRFIQSGVHPDNWNQGGRATLISYLVHTGKKEGFFTVEKGEESALKPDDIPQTHQSFFDSQKLYHADEQNRCFVHGGLNRHLPLDKQKEEDFYWDRSLWRKALRLKTDKTHIRLPADFYGEVDFKEIYIGHSPTTIWNTDKPMRAFNILNLDTGAGYNGRLTIMDIETKEYWQSDPLLELYVKSFR